MEARQPTNQPSSQPPSPPPRPLPVESVVKLSSLFCLRQKSADSERVKIGKNKIILTDSSMGGSRVRIAKFKHDRRGVVIEEGLCMGSIGGHPELLRWRSGRETDKKSPGFVAPGAFVCQANFWHDTSLQDGNFLSKVLSHECMRA